MRLSNSVLLLDDRARRISCHDEDFFGAAMMGISVNEKRHNVFFSGV
jgi:hypothetical protein